jgi:hypothetical protein
MPWPSADLAPWQVERLEKILGQEGSQARKAFAALVKAGCDRRELAFLLTRELSPRKKPLTGGDREDYQETLTRVAGHLREVRRELGLRPVRDIALGALGGRWRAGLVFANFCRDLADLLEFQAKHVPKIKLSPRNQFWFDIMVEANQRTGKPRCAEAATLANAILRLDGESATVTRQQLSRLYARRTRRDTPHKDRTPRKR